MTIKKAKSEKAGRNKTLQMTDDERKALRAHLKTIDDIVAGGADNDAVLTDAVVNADVIEALSHMPDAFADLIIIDPPYNLPRKFGDTAFRRTSDEEYEAYLRTWLPEVCRKLKAGGSLYLCGDWKCSYVMHKVLSEYLTVINRITWQREKGRGTKLNWKNSMEDIWFAVADTANYYFDVEAVKQRRQVRAPYRVDGKAKDWHEDGEGKYRMTHPSNFWDDITVPFWSMPENTDHPTQKPEKLYAKLILASSRKGDIVFDPFMGSGTAAVVAKKLGRRFTGIELSEEYCLWALKRLQRADSDPTIQGYVDGVFRERNSIR